MLTDTRSHFSKPADVLISMNCSVFSPEPQTGDCAAQRTSQQPSADCRGEPTGVWRSSRGPEHTTYSDLLTGKVLTSRHKQTTACFDLMLNLQEGSSDSEFVSQDSLKVSPHETTFKITTSAADTGRLTETQHVIYITAKHLDMKEDVRWVYLQVQVSSGLDEHLNQSFISRCRGVHQRSHSLQEQTHPEQTVKVFLLMTLSLWPITAFDWWHRSRIKPRRIQVSSSLPLLIMLVVTRALTWSSMVFTPSAPRSRVACWTRSARPHESILKPRSSWNLAEAASESKHLKDWKQHSDLQDADGHITLVLHLQLISSDCTVLRFLSSTFAHVIQCTFLTQKKIIKFVHDRIFFSLSREKLCFLFINSFTKVL